MTNCSMTTSVIANSAHLNFTHSPTIGTEESGLPIWQEIINGFHFHGKVNYISSNVVDLVVKPAQNMNKAYRSRKCIWGHIPMHAIFAVFIYFFIPVLSRSYFTSRTPDKDHKVEQLFYFLLVQVPQPGDSHELRGERFCACHSQALEKVPRAKSG